MYSAPLRTCDICFVSDSISDAAHDAAPEAESDLSSTATIDLRNDGCFRRDCFFMVDLLLIRSFALPHAVLCPMTVFCRVLDEKLHRARKLSHCRRREKFARDIEEKLCYVARVYNTEIKSIAESDRDLFNMERDADVRMNSNAPSGGTAMFQGTGERVAKEPTALAPSTMNGMDWNIHLVFFQHISARPDVYLFFALSANSVESRGEIAVLLCN